MDDLEEGELPEETDATIDRKDCHQIVGSVLCSEPVVASLSASQSFRSVNKAMKLRRNSSSDSDSDEGQQSQSDDDYEPKDKKWQGSRGSGTMAGSNLNNILSGGDCNQSTATALQRQKKYNIWGSVLEEQSLAKGISGWFGVNKKVDSDRDVETYDYTNAAKDDRSDLDLPDLPSSSQVENLSHFDVPDLSDKETFGTDAVVKKTVSPVSNYSSEGQSDTDDCSSNKESRVRRPHVNDPNRPAAKGRLGVRTEDTSSSSPDNIDSLVSVGEEIHRVLNEPAHMKITFVRIAQILGAEKARFLLHKTKVLEASGGLKILNGDRRRTPGGVYLYLLKGDEGVTKEQYKEIFKEKFEEQKRIHRETKKRRWNDRLVIIEKSALSSADMEFVESDASKVVPTSQGRCMAEVSMPAEISDGEFEDTETVNIQLDL